MQPIKKLMITSLILFTSVWAIGCDDGTTTTRGVSSSGGGSGGGSGGSGGQTYAQCIENARALSGADREAELEACENLI